MQSLTIIVPNFAARKKKKARHLQVREHHELRFTRHSEERRSARLENSRPAHHSQRRARYQHASNPRHDRAEAISHARVGAQKLWAGTVVVHPNAKTGPHHHGELETVIYVVRGRARFRWGNNLEFVDETGPGDFVFVPPYVPHQELNARKDEPVEAVIVRSGQEPVVVNLDIPSPEDAPDSSRDDPFHSAPGRASFP
jgi:uncharacterized RmlC-like cupin family protein